MDKELMEDGRNERRRPFRLSIRTLSIKLLVLVLLVGSLVLISGNEPGHGLLRFRLTINRLFHQGGCTKHKELSVPSNDDFRLVEVHRAGVGKRRNQVYQVLNIPEQSNLHTLSPAENGVYNIPSMAGRTTHLADLSKHSTRNYMLQSRLIKQAARGHLTSSSSSRSLAAEWVTRDINIPNITSKHAVTTIAKVSSNAYIRIPDTEDWFDLGHKWNETNDFGWDENGLRGHVFANTDNSTIIMAMKGTSPPFVGGSDTSTNDKINVLEL
jgi:putative lipase involved disintegration of autophagic bodies